MSMTKQKNGENKETMSIVIKLLIIICPHFGLKGTSLNCPDKIHYHSHYNLRSSAFVLFELAYSYAFIFKIPASGTAFQNTGFLPASAKLAVKYRPARRNTGHLATLLRKGCRPLVYTLKHFQTKRSGSFMKL